MLLKQLQLQQLLLEYSFMSFWEKCWMDGWYALVLKMSFSFENRIFVPDAHITISISSVGGATQETQWMDWQTLQKAATGTGWPNWIQPRYIHKIISFSRKVQVSVRFILSFRSHLSLCSFLGQGCRRFETSVFFSVKINISTTGGFRVRFFQPDTNHP